MNGTRLFGSHRLKRKIRETNGISERVALFSISPLWCPKRQLSSIVLKVSLIQGLFSVNGTTDYQKEFTSPEFRLTIAKPRRLLPT